MKDFQKIANMIWAIAELLRGSWKNYEYEKVILPFTVLKRLDTALLPTKKEVLETFEKIDGRNKEQLNILKRKTGFDFYNTSAFTLESLLDDPTHLVPNFQKYLDGYSDNIKDIFDKFEFEKTLERLKKGRTLYRIIQKFNEIDLTPERVPNYVIGHVFEDLIRRFAEQSNETAGEHYTPRDVIELMAAVLFSGETDALKKRGAKEMYDPACGTGGMLTVGKDYVKEHFNKEPHLFLFGQELNPQTYAICKSDILLKGEDAEHIKGGQSDHVEASTLSNDQHKNRKFDYIISNPPYGVNWKEDEDAVKEEYERGQRGRFSAGLPAISDGQLLFLQHAISKFRPLQDGGSRAAIITNGSPLFTGDAGSGPSEIRRWMMEIDYIEAIIALPESLFFNTGIPTYIWVFSNKKEAKYKDKIQLIDARKQRSQRRKNLGEKRFDIAPEHTKQILDWYEAYKENDNVKILSTIAFAYRAVTIQRPLRLNFQVTDERVERIKSHTRFTGPEIKEDDKETDVKKKEKKVIKAQEDLTDFEKTIEPVLKMFDNTLYKDRAKFLEVFEKTFKDASVRLDAPIKKIILEGLSERDETAEVCKKANGDIEPDPELKDIERVPFGKDIQEYFDEEVKPYVPDAWIDMDVRDHKDEQIGKVGYEIPFVRHFYQYEPPRPVEQIDEEIKVIESEIQEILKQL
jgi:type I restriction enzyme M protein